MDEKLREALATGRELYAKKEYARAKPHLEDLVAQGVGYADIYNMLGVVQHDQGQFSKAVECFERALEINPAYTEAGLHLAVTYNDMGKYAEAKGVYQRALTESVQPGGKLDAFVMGKLANLYADIAEVYHSSGAFDDAIAEYRRALRLRPHFIDLRLRLAQTLRDAGQVEDALRETKIILAQNPDFVPARIHMGISLFSRGDIEESQKALQAVLDDDPSNSRAQLYLKMIRDKAGS